MRANPYLLLTLTALFFGGNTVAGRLAVDHISPYQLVFLRWLLVAAAMACLLRPAKIRAVWHALKHGAGRIFCLGAAGFTGFNTLFYIAAHKTSAVNLGILQGTIPVWVLLGAYVFYRARAGVWQTAGVLITVCGVGVLAARGEWRNLAALAGLNGGDMLMLLACFIYAGYTLGLKKRPAAVDGLSFFFLLSCSAMLAAAPLLVLEWAGGGASLPTARGWLVLLYVAVFPSCLAHIFFIRGVELLGPARAGVFLNLIPVFAALCAVAFIGETLRWYQFAALLLVLGGLTLSENAGKSADARR